MFHEYIVLQWLWLKTSIIYIVKALLFTFSINATPCISLLITCRLPFVSRSNSPFRRSTSYSPMGSLGAGLPYWQVNVPEDERTEECPDFLRVVNAKDKGILSTLDEEYHVNTWPEVQKLILDNRLDLFQRVPSELRRYLEFSWKLKQEHGSVMNFILSQRLRWDVPLMPKGKPFECDEDIKILWNDWPYGLDKKIVHIVVWTKFDLEDDPATDDLTPKARAEIDAFVLKTFGSRVPSDHYIWFKNWRSLKSVQAVEHFHVMLYDPDPAFIDEITKGDIPLIQKV